MDGLRIRQVRLSRIRLASDEAGRAPDLTSMFAEVAVNLHSQGSFTTTSPPTWADHLRPDIS